MSESELSEDEDAFFDREIAKNACVTLKKYFEAHITIMSREYKNASSEYACPEVPLYKVGVMRKCFLLLKKKIFNSLKPISMLIQISLA